MCQKYGMLTIWAICLGNEAHGSAVLHVLSNCVQLAAVEVVSKGGYALSGCPSVQHLLRMHHDMWWWVCDIALQSVFV